MIKEKKVNVKLTGLEKRLINLCVEECFFNHFEFLKEYWDGTSIYGRKENIKEIFELLKRLGDEDG